MFSVVIPTIWKSDRIFKLLEDLENTPQVGEIIIINNDSQNTPSEYNPPSKVKTINLHENIFVNPSWNLGVSEAKYPNISLINDDINFNTQEFYKLLEPLDLQHLGFIGMHSDNYEITEANPKLIYKDVNKGYGWGCLITFSKANWVEIPNQLKIWFGDNFIEMQGKPILQMVGFPIQTEMSTTSDLEIVKEVKDNDIKEWNLFLNSLR